MNTETVSTPSPLKLTLSKNFNQSIEKLYQAWTNEKAVAQWFTPSSEWKCIDISFKAKTGNPYFVMMKATDGKLWRVEGTFQEVIPNERIVFTWDYPGADSIGLTVVSVRFLKSGQTSKIELTHQGFKNESDRSEHQWGWEGCTGNLERFFDSES